MKQFPLRVAGIGLVALALLAGCEDTSPSRPAAQEQTHARTPPQDFAPGLTGETPTPVNEAQLTNDASAPLDTPLCGAVQQETNHVGGQVFSEALNSGSACVRNACFNPLTGTYIAASGAPSICR